MHTVSIEEAPSTEGVMDVDSVKKFVNKINKGRCSVTLAQLINGLGIHPYRVISPERKNLDRQEISVRLGVSDRTVKRMQDAGILSVVIIKGRVFSPISDIERIEQHGTG
jgi:hypothetical protein